MGVEIQKNAQNHFSKYLRSLGHLQICKKRKKLKKEKFYTKETTYKAAATEFCGKNS